MSQIPEVLKTKNLSVMSNMDIYTSVLEPITKSQTRVNFILRKQGILDSGSRFVFTIGTDDAATSAAGEAFLCAWSGCNASISSAICRVGTRVLCETQDAGQMMTMRSSVHTASQKKNIDMVLNGSMGNLGPSPAVDGKYAFADAIYATSTAGAVPLKYKLVQSTTDCATWSIGIADLFPMMRGLQLPLFAMNEPLNIEINLTQQANGTEGATCVFTNAPGTTTATSYGLENMQMHIDYLQYDDATMNGIRDAIWSEDGMPLRYDDLAVTTTQVPAVAQPALGAVSESDVVREIGSSGLKVNNVLIQEKTAGANALLGDYRSDSMIHPEQYNFRVNDRIIYPRRVFNTSLQKNEVEQVLEWPMSCPSVVYSLDTQNDFHNNNDGAQNPLIDATCLLETQNPLTTCAGTQHYVGLNLRKGPGGEGTKVHQKNILYERHTTHSRNDYGVRELKFFVEYERDFILRNGNVSLSA